MTANLAGARRHRALHWTLLIAGSAALAFGLRTLEAPAAFLLGPLVVAIALAQTGTAIRPAPIVFLAAQATVGTMIAMSTTLALWSAFGANWLLYLSMGVATLASATGLGWLMTRRGWMTGSTAVWGLAPGAATAMILMSDAFGGDQRQVAFMQYVRILIVALTAIALAHLAGTAGAHAHGVDWFGVRDGTSLLVTLAFIAVSGWLGRRSRIPAGVLLVPMLVGGLFQAFGVLHLTLPPVILAAAYAVIGWQIGLQFSRQALLHSARAAPRMIMAVVVLLATCGLVAIAAHWLTGVDLLSAWLATSPGGTDTILIIATSTPVDLSFILGAQLARFLLVLLAGPFIARAASRHSLGEVAP